RLALLESAVKRVFASMFFQRARDYIRVTPHRLEEEKMAVIVQRLVGSRHGERFYPDISGVARSHNFYPSPPMQSADGVVSVALGLGKTVVEGGAVLRFCPKYPRHLIGLSSPRDYLDYTQRTFYSLDLAPFEEETDPAAEPELIKLDLTAAEEDGTLPAVGSVYVPQEDRIVEGLLQEGVRIVDFAPILKNEVFPLPQLVKDVLDVAAAGMSGPVEMEFAVRLAKPEGDKPEFDVLQLRPLVIGRELIELNIEDHPLDDLICQCPQVMGVGRVDDIRDVVVVDKDRFERGASREVAAEVGRLNRKLAAEGVPYLLIGVGRWGSSDPWLGIPVAWEQISGARVIVEAGFKDFKVTPSQGAHFFQNITAMRIGYFTVNLDGAEAFLDWDWLLAQPAAEILKYTRHVRLAEPAVVLMNGHKSKGIILKPGLTS
ncbi:PEP/pyruvate-binding domain-containing protein, partial [bacterium]|nr:PEP/pyruvate-binding domain-containing protein [bacterium]